MFDVLVIGGSFAGLSAAMQLARAKRTVCVVDAGSPRNRFAAASHGFFGQDGAAPLEMIATARENLLAYPNVTFIPGQVTKAMPASVGFQIVMASGDLLAARKLILAFGLTDEIPTLPGLPERWGHSVLHCPYCHGYEFGGRPLGVLYICPLSLHQAMLIPEWGPTTLFLNGQAEPNETIKGQLLNRNVAIETAPIVALEGHGVDLSGVRLSDGRLVELAALYFPSKTSFQSPLAEQLGCALDDGPLGKIIRTDEAKLTTVPGVYAAGDIVRVPHNTTWASADGVTAGMAAHRALVFEPR